MQEFKKSHVPAFGSWDCNDDLPFTQCFESARQAGLLRYSYSQDRDLYVTGDLYQNDVVTPAVIVVPRRRVILGILFSLMFLKHQYKCLNFFCIDHSGQYLVKVEDLHS